MRALKTVPSIDEIVASINTEIQNRPLAFGHIYLIESTCGTRVKIGRSRHPNKRVAAIRTSVGGIGRYFISGCVSNQHAIELALHRAFSASRDIGEWFFISFDTVLPIIEGVCERLPVTPELKDQVDRERRLSSEHTASFVDWMLARTKPNPSEPADQTIHEQLDRISAKIDALSAPRPMPTYLKEILQIQQRKADEASS